jgi:hypothetical protein
MAWPKSSRALSVVEVEVEGEERDGGSRFEARFTRRGALPEGDGGEAVEGENVDALIGMECVQPGFFFIAFSRSCCALWLRPIERRAFALKQRHGVRCFWCGLTAVSHVVAGVGMVGLDFQRTLVHVQELHFCKGRKVDHLHVDTVCPLSHLMVAVATVVPVGIL